MNNQKFNDETESLIQGIKALPMFGTAVRLHDDTVHCIASPTLGGLNQVFKQISNGVDVDPYKISRVIVWSADHLGIIGTTWDPKTVECKSWIAARITELQKQLFEAHQEIAALKQGSILTTKPSEFLSDVANEIAEDRKGHSPINSLHEGYSVILEELDEVWDEVKKKRKDRDPARIRKELVQVAAMAMRTAEDVLERA